MQESISDVYILTILAIYISIMNTKSSTNYCQKLLILYNYYYNFT